MVTEFLPLSGIFCTLLFDFVQLFNQLSNVSINQVDFIEMWCSYISSTEVVGCSGLGNRGMKWIRSYWEVVGFSVLGGSGM